MNDLSENEYVVKSLLPATTNDIADTMEVSISYVYDLIQSLKDKGYQVAQDSEGRYYIGNEQIERAQNTEAVKQSSGEKAAITRKARKYLATLEYELKETLNESEAPVAEEIVQRPDATDMVIHRTDDHFGELVTNQYGDELFNTEIAANRVEKIFEETVAIKERREDAGETFDTANLLLGGDIITNDDLYDGQAHEIDCDLNEQLDIAGDVYIDAIKQLSDAFPSVRVVCQPGNHGRLSQGSPANADTILYSMLDKVVRESDINNVTFLKSDRSYYINFSLRNWNAHLRHGHDSSLEHIGTSAGKQRWLTWLVDHQFDVAYRGHYHLLKEEPVAGIPVHMGGSLLPQTEFEESHALSGRAGAAVHGATDEHPSEWTERVVFN